MYINLSLIFLLVVLQKPEVAWGQRATCIFLSMSISLLSVQIAEMIRHLLDVYEQPIPAVLEIPSKDHPYDPSKDSILRRAKVRERVCVCVCV